MKRLRAAVIGIGFIGPAHIEAVRRLGFADVVAVVGSSLDQARQKAEELGVPKAYGDYREVLHDPEIDVIHNCTPNHLHFEINKAAILAGKHVLSEKPLAITAGECRELCELAEQHGVIGGVNFNYRAYSMVQHLRALVADGHLGTVYLVHGHYLQDWLLYDTDYNWRIRVREGGPLCAIADIGSHWIDLVQHVTGQRVVSVCADLRTVIPVRRRPATSRQTFGIANDEKHVYDESVQTEDYGAVLFRMDGGASGTFLVSQVSAGRKNKLTVEIDGSQASACWNQEEPERLWIGHRDRPNEIVLDDPTLLHERARTFCHYPGGHNEAWADGLKNTMLAFYRYLACEAGNRPPQPPFATFADAYQCALVNEAILQSQRSRAWVDVPSE
ncbi:Gfo/Idh/MocA family protein [Alicyclobacillus macrosporangiidus]|uniref:Predicted dehydrogenase n=1 Tax=Alicyclobacillus macrosporangiidus TaxID=392015 RepID=A0A1I7L4V0_9BACL|nr:Gfo/Idh/MocA family oxidoreductase [Alicyclobacillus macrosporangiidus]SFV04730.1 Predicted dehydrogenase [Alicyclobacillus macrosporangiidus]